LPELERYNQVYRIDTKMCVFDYFFDKKTNILHIIDLHEKDSLELSFVLTTNAIGFVYHVHKLFEKAFNFRMPPNFKLFVYSADKIVCEWREDRLQHIPYQHFEKIHLPYLRKKRERKVAYLE
jgi:hypothetical protein